MIGLKFSASVINRVCSNASSTKRASELATIEEKVTYIFYFWHDNALLPTQGDAETIRKWKKNSKACNVSYNVSTLFIIF